MSVLDATKPKTRFTKVVAKAVIQNPEGKVLLLRRNSDDYYRPGGWDLPGGSVDDGEDCVAAMLREIREETGLKLGFRDVHLVHTQMGVRDGEVTCYLNFIGFTDRSEVRLSREHDEYHWLDFEDMVKTNTVSRHQDIFRFIWDNQFLA